MQGTADRIAAASPLRSAARAAPLALCLFLGAAVTVHAQADRKDGPGRGRLKPGLFLPPPNAPPVPLLRRPWVRPLASFLVPGTGQMLAGNAHGMVYLGAEAWAAWRALSLDQRGRRERESYRELAFRVARGRFAVVRRDGPFEYYEAMERFVESGRYDADPGAGFLPEPDTSTFNGAMWLLARRTFFVRPDSLPAPDSPAYLAALAFYDRRAVREEFRWSWRDARLEQDVYRQAIRASDEAFRAATNHLGVLVFNHLASAVDALIAARLTGREGTVPAVSRPRPDGPLYLIWHVSF